MVLYDMQTPYGLVGDRRPWLNSWPLLLGGHQVVCAYISLAIRLWVVSNVEFELCS